MKHTLSITLILIGMFVFTQIVGLIVTDYYSSSELPYGMQPEKPRAEISFLSLIITFIIAIFLIFILMKINAITIIRGWFFLVVVIAISISFYAFLSMLKIGNASIISLIIGLFLAFLKVFKPNMIIHNLTETLIYPGVSAVLLPIINIWMIILLLILISIYDIWAVWHSGFMQKMAKFQMEEVKIFGGLLIPYMNRKNRLKLRKIRQKYKNMKMIEKQAKRKKITMSLAILGGGDIIFPIITSGVFLRTYGIVPSIFIIVGSTLSLALLFFLAKKGKFYPAMPFITSGIFASILLWMLLTLII